MASTTEDFIACLDSNIHFTKNHVVADKKINPFILGKLFNRYENILIPEEGHLKEASQATMFFKLAEKGVVSVRVMRCVNNIQKKISYLISLMLMFLKTIKRCFYTTLYRINK